MPVACQSRGVTEPQRDSCPQSGLMRCSSSPGANKRGTVLFPEKERRPLLKSPQEKGRGAADLLSRPRTPTPKSVRRWTKAYSVIPARRPVSKTRRTVPARSVGRDDSARRRPCLPLEGKVSAKLTDEVDSQPPPCVFYNNATKLSFKFSKAVGDPSLSSE